MNNKKILIACEESQTITNAFRRAGYEAYSCDVEDCSGGHPEWHIKGDCLHLLKEEWALLIGHPPCTYITNAGVRHLHDIVSKNGNRAKISGKARWDEMEKACEFFLQLANANIPRICLENPIPHKYAKKHIGEYTQLIQPWMFGHMETKATCLWLKNLPKLTETNNVKQEMLKLPKKERHRIHYMSPGPDRARLRSKTYEGIAQAIVEQWGPLL